MLLLTGHHRSGTSGIYYDLISRVENPIFFPPARPLADLVKFFSVNQTESTLFIPVDVNLDCAIKRTIDCYVKEIYGDADYLFLKSTDFIYDLNFINFHFDNTFKVIIYRNPIDVAISYLKTQGLISEAEFSMEMLAKTCESICDVYNLALSASSNDKKTIWIEYESYVCNPESQICRINNLLGKTIFFEKAKSDNEIYEWHREAFFKKCSNDSYWKKFLTELSNQSLSSKSVHRGRSKLSLNSYSDLDKLIVDKIDPCIAEGTIFNSFNI